MKYKLGECIEEIVDKTTENNQYEVLSVTKDGIYSQEEFFKKQIASEDNTGYKIIRKNNLVFSTMNLWMGSLDVLSNYEIGIVSPAYKIFKFNESKMIPSFGKYFMKSHFMLEQYKNCSEQGASVVRRNLDLKQLLDTEIIIPTVEEQCKIAKVLENIDEIINKYTNLIKNKKQFIKSIFVEMFEKSDEGIKTKVEDVCKEMKIGPFGSALHKKEIRETGEVFVLGTDNAVDNEFKVYERRYIDNNKYQQLVKYTVHEGDMIISMMGTIGKTAIIPNEFGTAIISSHLCCLTPDDRKITSRFLNNIFKYSSLIKYQINQQQRGAVMNGLNLKIIKNLEFNLPSMNLQNQFEKIANLIDKQKFELEKQKQNYIDLKKGLMQQLLTGKVKLDV